MSDVAGPDSETLLRRASAGDAHARADLLDRMVAMRLDRRLAARVDASDVVQEALQDAYERLPEYFADPRIPFYPWLRRIATDRLVDAHRRHIGAERRSVLKERPWMPEVNIDSVAELARGMAATSIVPSREAMDAELEARIASALMHLKAHDREVLVLRYLEQLGVGEISVVLGISPTAVTSRHLRALQRLRRLVGED
jgi:RNA polymerase sigma-70 factor (ECF subfamily)